MTTAELVLPPVQLILARPGTPDPTLRAWDAADELLLLEAASAVDAGARRLLVVDDQFGALAVGLASLPARSAFSLTVVADSAALPAALAGNARANPGAVPPTAVHSWLSPPTGPFDLVVMRIPRQADYLAWLLRWINGALTDAGLLLAGGMIKHIPDRSVDVFAGNVMTESVPPARKKARVVRCRRGDSRLDGWSGSWKGYEEEAAGGRVEALPAVFGRESLDLGTRVLLPHALAAAGRLQSGAKVLDLACGNGMLGLAVLSRASAVQVTFSDVSSQAVLSSRSNAERLAPGANPVFEHADGVPEAGGPWDLILLNPPFHEGGVVGDHIALRLFQQASRRLAPTGRLVMVGNRHLGYHRSLRRYFRQVRQLDASPKFVVFEAAP